MSDHREKIKTFLTIKLEECAKTIIKYNKKYKIIKIIYYSMMTTSIIGSYYNFYCINTYNTTNSFLYNISYYSNYYCY